MSGHWEAEQYKEQLEASRTAHAACEAARREGLEVQRVLGVQCDRNLAEIDRLRAELSTCLAIVQHLSDVEDLRRGAEARLAVVIALCDDAKRCDSCLEQGEVRAAATGDTK